MITESEKTWKSVAPKKHTAIELNTRTRFLILICVMGNEGDKLDFKRQFLIEKTKMNSLFKTKNEGAKRF